MLRHLVQFSILYQYFSSASQPTTYTLNEAKAGKQVQVIENNESLAVKLKGIIYLQEFFVLKTERE
jgi:dipeptidyl-peptidase-4